MLIIQLLISDNINSYFVTEFRFIADTTKSDIEGYKVCSKKEFLSMIKHKEFFEYSKVGSYYFGTAYESVRDLVVLGKVCLLDVHPQVYIQHFTESVPPRY